MSSVPDSEISSLLHPEIAVPDQWCVSRYEVELNKETGLPSFIILELHSKDNEVKRLKFDEPHLAEFGLLQIPQTPAIYIAKTGSLGWESSKSIEVGEWHEDRSVLFWAAGVSVVA